MIKKIFFILLAQLILASQVFAKEKPILIFYCGITMVKPITKMAKIIEKKYNCIIKISQGGSKDLYDSLKRAKKGDLYLPGSDSYRIKNLKDGYLIEGEYIGYNQAAIFVQKNNPKNIKNLESFLDENIYTILCNATSGSIGKMTKNIFLNYKGEFFYNEAHDNSVEIGTDSRNLNKALIDKKVDLTINWKATASWDENSKYIDYIPLNEKLAPKKKLRINLLSFSKNKKIAKAFIDFAISKEGQKIMKNYGFL